MNRNTTGAALLLLALGCVLFLPRAGRGQEGWPRAPRRPLTWEYIDASIVVHRAKVPGGWLIVLEHPTSRGAPIRTGCTFYPDPKHEWDGGSLD